jgi:YidC/Oxa1 family membrane protein insertase
LKELSNEQRLLLALVLSIVVVTVSDLVVFRHMRKPANQPVSQTMPAAPAAQKPEAAMPAAPPPAAKMPAPAQRPPAAPATTKTAQPAVAAANEQNIVVDSGLYRVVLSNRGAVVRSWQLKRYHDESKPPKVLDVVHPPANSNSEEWPLSLLLVDPKLQSEANSALYEVKSAGLSLRAPADVEFSWSNGHLKVTKDLEFGYDYVTTLQTTVTLDGQPMPYAVAWRGGFGDPTVYHAYDQVEVFHSNDGKVTLLESKKLGASDHPEVPAQFPGTLQFAGIEDHYFAAAFLPPQGQVTAWSWRTEKPGTGEDKGTKEPVAEVAVSAPAPTPGPLVLRLYVGPKSLSELGKVNTHLRALVNYGFFGFIAEPLFYVLRFIQHYVPNWGWAIVVLTLVLNMALFPLKMSQWRSMQKMQRVMPEMKSIQGKYKKYPMKDPRRQKMNEEMMELYKREGINPLGSCLPMLMQMPIWFALYEMLEVAIELRHAPWIFWVHDLSTRDPYYVIPLLLMAAGYFMQKMTPVATPDPAQQKMMNYMPVLLGLLFFRLASGLNLYILSSYIVGIGQQWYLNKTAPAPAPATGKAKRQAVER